MSILPAFTPMDVYGKKREYCNCMNVASKKRLSELVEQAIEVREPNRNDLAWLLTTPDLDTLEIVSAVGQVRKKFFGTRVKMNFLLNIQSGLCPEDCNYCSQARGSEAPIPKYSMVEESTFCDAATMARDVGATRLCLVASGRGPNDREIRKVAEGVEAVKKIDPSLEICACLGLLGEGQAEQLQEAGVFAYNHNLNTSENFYGDICSTHTFSDRKKTVELAKEEGLSPCSGALFGMGETNEDILDTCYALRELNPDSVPINFLIPITGTPLSSLNELTPQKCLRILSIFRLMFPDREVRIAGGREVHLRAMQPLGLHLANSIFIGDYLTTKGQSIETDLEMIKDAGFEIEGGGPQKQQSSGVPEIRLKQSVLD